ncbi:MAG: hypothetical protein MJ078_03885, partial [Clostridia bacterium]|nr:hypothetical protein [Clostridia bacterium]
MSDCRCNTGPSAAPGCGSGNRETVCVDTMRVLDSCRDKDCYEDVRVLLTPFGQELIDRTGNVRVNEAKVLGAEVSVNPVAFNPGFFQTTVRYYIRCRCEACLSPGRAQEFTGLCVADKNVVLYGGEGNVVAFRSNGIGGFCPSPFVDNKSDNLPTAVVETVDPVVLSAHVAQPCREDDMPVCPCGGLPEPVLNAFPDGAPEWERPGGNNRLYVSLGIFSVVRIQRPGQFLVSAQEYSVPE